MPAVAAPAETIDLWPENVEVWGLWVALVSQWRLVTGLTRVAWAAPDHVNAMAVITAFGVKKRRRKDLFNALCEMEMEALSVLNAAE